jgi:hypothetical protein
MSVPNVVPCSSTWGQTGAIREGGSGCSGADRSLGLEGVN